MGAGLGLFLVLFPGGEGRESTSDSGWGVTDILVVKPGLGLAVGVEKGREVDFSSVNLERSKGLIFDKREH